MTAIPSVSENDSASEGPISAAVSREPSHNTQLDTEGPRRRASNVPGTVTMSRSTSLPVMTIRELEALKEKDGELGIARGGGWAWVSQELHECVSLQAPV